MTSCPCILLGFSLVILLVLQSYKIIHLYSFNFIFLRKFNAIVNDKVGKAFSAGVAKLVLITWKLKDLHDRKEAQQIEIVFVAYNLQWSYTDQLKTSGNDCGETTG